MYVFYNANSFKRYINDCTIRAISLATNKSWNDTYKELSDKARRMGMMMDDARFIEYYLDNKYERTCSNSLYVGDFIEEHPTGTYLITMKGHITCVINGVLYDTFDCRDRKMWCAWKVK